jgi:transposase
MAQISAACELTLWTPPAAEVFLLLLESIGGAAFVSAAAILSELATLHGADVRQTIACAGLNPRQNQSGSSVRGQSRLSKTGNMRLRKALYMPALTGWHHNPILAAFAARLLASGKKKMQVLGALMHKLLALCCGVLRTRRPFDPAWLTPEPPEA